MKFARIMKTFDLREFLFAMHDIVCTGNVRGKKFRKNTVPVDIFVKSTFARGEFQILDIKQYTFSRMK